MTDAQLFEPQPFGRFYLVDKIATGGMAEIFKAKTFSEGGFENLVAIKRILPHIGENDDFVEMFIDEAKVSATLQHPNIIRIYDFGKLLDNYYIAMECVEGKDTRRLLRKLGRAKRWLPPKFACLIAHEVAKGLHYAHHKTDLENNPYGIIHRDISPANVLISYDGHVKIADFGIAKAESNAYQTRDGVLKGKFEYMSPEQAAGHELDARSDLFSLGIIMYECLTGRRLFKTDSEVATLRKIRDCDFVPPRKYNPRIPEEIEAIVLQTLDKAPGDRYQSGLQLADAIRDVLFPQTPDQIRREFTAFLDELFADEIESERMRLQHGTVAALALHKSAPADGWNERTSSTMVESPRSSSGTLMPWALAILMMLFLVAGATVGGLYLLVRNAMQEPVVQVVEVPEPVVEMTTGDLHLTVKPAAKVFVDDVQASDEPTADLDLLEIEPGSHTLRLEASGFQTLEEEVHIVAGEATNLRLNLLPEVKEPAPVTKRVGAPSPRTQRPATPQPAAPGSLTVTLAGGGWAHVYVDGEKLTKTAPLRKYALPAGSYTIRVENENLGVRHEQQVTVAAGSEVRVTARPE